MEEEVTSVKKVAKLDNKHECAIVAQELQCATDIQACVLLPHSKACLFVAWNGVLVLVYDGFPPSLCNAKKIIQKSISNLKPENFGSKWPKTTLAAVNDQENTDLTIDDFKELKSICTEYSQKIALTNTSIEVRTISTVEYYCRSLEKLRSRTDIQLDEPKSADQLLYAESTADEKDTVNNVVKEWDDLCVYLAKVNAPGSRIGSYREECSSGATCVTFLDPVMPNTLKGLLADFQIAVEDRFPGRYSWLDETSLHCTLRSLDRTV